MAAGAQQAVVGEWCRDTSFNSQPEFVTLKSTSFKTRINTVGWSDEENHCVQCILWDGNCSACGDPWEIDLIIN